VARLELSLFGGFSAGLGGQPITTFKSDKVRALLAYLAAESDRAHRRDSLATLLWPGFLDTSARASLRGAVYDLRQVIDDYDVEPPFLLITRETIRFNPESDHMLDVARFADLAKTGDDDPDRRGKLASAVDLYEGEFLEGFTLDDAVTFDDWSSTMREGLHRQVVEVLGRLVGLCEACGDVERGLDYAWRLVELAPWQESGQRQLMRLLAFDGKRSEALMQYEACRRALQEALGVEPSAETTRLFECIRDGAIAGAGDKGATAQAKAAPLERRPRHNLPAQLTPLIGRETELAQIDAYLSDPACRLLTLVGPGGVGKTRLSLAVGERRLNRFRHGVFFVPLEALKSFDGIVPAIAAALDFTFSREVPDQGAMSEPGSPKDQLLAYLRGKEVLLILDNAEHLLYASEGTHDGHSLPGFLLELLETAPRLKVLVTSQVRLQMHGQQLLPLDGLRVEGALESPMSPAISLFLEAAQRVRPDFSVTQDNAEAILAICRAVSGMPLAILLAAAWVEVMTPQDILEALTAEMESGLDLLTVDWRDVPERHRGIRATFDGSWALLTPEERSAFAALSVFRGSFTLQAARTIAGLSLRALGSLVRKSMVQVADGRYTIHPLLRHYAAERLAQMPGTEREVVKRHAEYYGAILSRWLEDSKGPQQVAALRQMDLEIDNARAAWDHTVDQADVPAIGRALDGLCWFYFRRFRQDEAFTACQAAVARLEAEAPEPETTEGRPPEPERLRVLCEVLHWQSCFVPPAESEALIDRVFEILSQPALEDVDVRRQRALVLRRMGALRIGTDVQGALELLLESLALFRKLKDCREESITLYSLSLNARFRGDLKEAQALSEKQLAISEQLGDLNNQAGALSGLRAVAFLTGRFEEAMQLGEAALKLYRNVDNLQGVAGTLHSMGNQCLVMGAHEDALQLYDESLAIYRELGAPGSYPAALRAWVLTVLGRYSEARRQAESALVGAKAAGDRHLQAWLAIVFSTLALVDGETGEAERWAEKGFGFYQAAGWPFFLAQAAAVSGCALALQGRIKPAEERLVVALRITVKMHAPGVRSIILPGLVLFFLARGQAERAVEAYTFAVEVNGFGETRWFQDVVSPAYEKAIAALPPEERAAAEARGRPLDHEALVSSLLQELDEGTSRSQEGGSASSA
jgi:predicted ATPase/DNA-binding SARP family transcriptional activator